MKITSIKAQTKNHQRVSVFLDNKYSFSLSLDQLLSEKLKKDEEISDGRLKQLKKLSEDGKIRQRALDWLISRRPHSIKELNDYLYRKNADKELSASIVEEFKKNKYVDDEYFAKWFIEQRSRKNRSKREISSELNAKGVAPDIINSAITDMQINEQESLEKLVNKLSKKSRYHDDNKLTSYLLSKGFSYPDIKQAIANNLKDNK